MRGEGAPESERSHEQEESGKRPDEPSREEEGQEPPSDEPSMSEGGVLRDDQGYGGQTSS